MNSFKLFFSRNRTPLHIHTAVLTGLDYNEIVDGIFIGTNQCCTMGLSEVLKKEGIQADISLEGERLDEPQGVEMYTWIPVVDHEIPTKDQLSFGVSVLQHLVSQHKKVYLHCKNGHGRSSTLLTTYLMKTRNISYEEAMKIIVEHRPGAHMQPKQVDFVKEHIQFV